MNKLVKLQGQRADTAAKMTAIHDKAVDEDRDFTEDEQTQWDALDAEEKRVSTQIEQEKRLIALNADLETSDRESEPPLEMVSRTTVGDDLTTQKPWESFGHYLVGVWRASLLREGLPGGYVDDRFKPEMLKQSRAATGASEGVDTAGGFLVKPQFETELFRVIHDQGAIISRLTEQVITGPKLVINAVDETSRANGSRWGGIQVYWANEAATVDSAKGRLREMELNLNKLFGLFYATSELLNDADALGGIANRAFAEEFNFVIEDRVVNGTGVGQPLGILNAACTVSHTRAVANQISTEDIIEMWARMHSRSRANAVWLIEQSIEPQLYTMDLATGTSGTTTFMPPGGLSGAPYATLLGRPIIPVEQCAALGTVSDIIFADLSAFLYVHQGAMSSDSSIHVRFVNDEVVFRYLMRLDIMPLWSSALTPHSSGNTLSPFVTLAAAS